MNTAQQQALHLIFLTSIELAKVFKDGVQISDMVVIPRLIANENFRATFSDVVNNWSALGQPVNMSGFAEAVKIIASYVPKLVEAVRK